MGLTGIFAARQIFNPDNWNDFVDGLKQTVPLISVRYGGVGLSLGYDSKGVAPYLQIGGLTYRFGDTNAQIGIFNIGGKQIVSKGSLYVLALSGAAYMIGLFINGDDDMDPEEAIGGLFAHLINTALPINNIREFINFFDYALANPSQANQIQTIYQFNKIISHFKSYGSQGLVNTALVKIDNLMTAAKDPYVRASLRQMKDAFLIKLKQVKFPVAISRRQTKSFQNPTSIIKENIKEAVTRAREFRLAHEAWMMGKTSERPAPTDKEIMTYMEDLLYLSNKLPMVVKTVDNEKNEGTPLHKIRGNSALCIEKPKALARYLTEVVRGYEALTAPESLFSQFIRNRINTKAKALHESMTVELKGEKLKGASIYQIFEDRTELQLVLLFAEQMANNSKAFAMRQKYIFWKIAKEAKSDEKQALIKAVRQLKLHDTKVITAIQEMTRGGEKSNTVALYQLFSPYYEGLEYMKQLSSLDVAIKGQGDAWERGLDVHHGKEVALTMNKGFYYLFECYKLIHTIGEKKGGLPPNISRDEAAKAVLSILARYKILLREATTFRTKEMFWDWQESPRDIRRDKEMFKIHIYYSIDEIDDAIDEIEDLEEYSDEEKLGITPLTTELKRKLTLIKTELEALNKTVLEEMDFKPYRKSIMDVVKIEKREAKAVNRHTKRINEILHGKTGVVNLLMQIYTKIDPKYNPDKKKVAEKAQKVTKEILGELHKHSERLGKAMNRLDKLQKRRASIVTMMTYVNKWGITLKPTSNDCFNCY